MTEIIKVLSGDEQFSLFQDFNGDLPISIATRDIVSLDFLDSCFVLLQNGKPIAKAALYDNPQLEFDGHACFSIGNYAAIDDLTAAKILLEYILKEAKSKGASYIIGPMNGSTWNDYRFSEHNRFPNFLMEPFQPLYYLEQFDSVGFQPIAKYFSSIDTTLICDQPAILRREQQLLDKGLSFRQIDLEHFDEDLDKLFEFNQIAFRDNFLYTPIGKESFKEKYANLKSFIKPEFVILAEDAESKLVGFIFAFPDLLNKSSKSLIIKTVARHPDQQWAGLGYVLGNLIYRQALELNFQSIVHAFMFEQGHSTKITKDFSGTKYKHYVLLGKNL
ncbi:MAG: hypothetical protein ABIV51_11025 [Saprospiraceae bacterium]